MARATLPLVRPAYPIDTTMVGWGLVALIGGLVLPWYRLGRELWVHAPDALGMALLREDWAVVLALVCAATAALVGVLPLHQVRRGQIGLPVGGIGALAVVAEAVLRNAPFGFAVVAAFLSFLALVGQALAVTGRLHADAFIAGSILWVAGFVALFIVYPLWSVLQASVIVKGHFTFDVFRETVRSPGYLLLNNPATPQNEVLIAVLIGAGVGALVAVGAVLLTRRVGSAVRGGVAAGGLGFALAALYQGFGAVRNSVLLAIMVGMVATMLGFLFALLGERSRLRTRRLLGPMSVLPIVTPPFVLGLAMIYLFGRRGFITYRLLGLSTNIFFGPLGVALAQILAFTPIAYLVLQGVVRSLDFSLEEAAQTLGASRWHVLRTVIWPLARPGVANAFLLVAIESLADFGNPIIVGGGAPFLATEVFFAIIGRFNPSEAAIYGVTLLAMTLTIFVIQRYWIGRRSYVTVTGRPSGASVQPLPPGLDYSVTAIFLGWVLLTLLLYGSVFTGSLTKLWGFDYTFTLKNLQDLHPQGWQVFWTSVRLSAIAAVPSTLIGFLIGYLVTRIHFPGRGALEFGSMLSFAIPGTVMGIGYILAFNQGALLLTGTDLILILAFVFRNMPVGIRAGVAAIHQIDLSIEEASTMLRAGSFTTLQRVVMPLARSALLSGLVFGFVRAMTAVSQVIFLISPQHNLATTQILSYVEYGSQGRGAALASLLIIFMVAAILGLYAITNRLDPRAAQQLGVGGAAS